MEFGVGTGRNSGSGGSSRFASEVGHVTGLAEAKPIAEAAFAMLGRLYDSLPIQDALALAEMERAHADASEATLLAARLEAGASARSVETLLQKGDKTSKRTAKTRTRRAKAVKQNPTIATKMKSGELSPDQADVIASGAEKTNGAAAEDDDLIDTVAATPPDQARKVVDDWVREHTSRDQVQDRYDRQRRLRSVKRWSTERDTDVLAIEGDTATIDRIETAIRNKSNQLYRADGGRNLPAGQHPRTRDQRNFDAAVDLLTNHGSSSDSGSGTNSSTSNTAGPRSTIVITMTKDQALGLDTSPIRQVGGGLLAPSLLEELFCGADLIGLVTDHTGLPLWLGRSTRYFTKEQVLALIARDQGCVLCRAHYSTCEAHHIIPWEAPARGPTDIDNGALVCADCHHRLHDHDLILQRDPTTGTWTTRAARPDEIAPKRKPTKPLAPDPAQPGKPESRQATATRVEERSDGSRLRQEHHRPKLHERPRTGALW